MSKCPECYGKGLDPKSGFGCMPCLGTGTVPGSPPSPLEERLTALEAEHAKIVDILEKRTTTLMAGLVTTSEKLIESRLAEIKLLARIQRSERLLVYISKKVEGLLPSLSLDPWARDLREAMAEDLVNRTVLENNP